MGTDPGLTFLHVLTIPRLCCSLYLRYVVFANAFLYLSNYHHLSSLAGVPVGGKSSVCLICMKYMIIILIIIIKRPGEILLSYIANTSRTRTHALTQC